jgi:hypothetical protein
MFNATKEKQVKTSYRAAIKMYDGRIVPVFAGRKSVRFPSIAKAVKKMESTKLKGRGLVWPSGTTLAEANWENIYTIAL